MLVSILASGSEGNSIYVNTDDTKLLIDIGMNYKYIKEKLEKINIKPNEIEYVFITHTHKDHISALEVFLKKNKPTVVLTKNMYNEIKNILKDYDNIIFTQDSLTIQNTIIESFKTSHDAVDSHGYLITTNNKSLVVLTDTGYLNQKFFSKLKDKTMYIIEANHDVEMALNGPYPKWLKTRILSDVGHLSNNATGFYLSKLIGPNTNLVVLAHLSSHNNTPENALNTVQKTLLEYDVNFNNIKIANQRELLGEFKL